jgi:flagellar motor switch/type III secretory pathway protein FliN
MTTSEVRPFPFASLDAVTREEARAERAMRAVVAESIDLAAVARALSEIAGGESVSVLLRRARKVTRARGADDFVGVALSARENATLADALLLEVEGALAAAVLRKTLKRAPARVHDKTRPPPAEIIGATAAVAGAVARRAHGDGAPIAVVAAGPGASLFADLLRASRDDGAFTLSLTVVFANEAFEARVSIARGALDLAPRVRFDADTLRALDTTPLSLTVVAAASSARARDIAALAPGDAWMPGAHALALANGNVAGPMILAAPRAEVGLAVRVEDATRVVFGGELQSLSWSAEGTMREDTGKTEVAIADAPVVVRVEVGACELPAREWAALKKGDVITLKKRLGEAVSLRVSGVEVAQGELVQIEGEVGVRILARTVGA